MLHFVPFFTIVRLPRMVFYTFAPQDVAADEGGSVEDMLSQCADAGVEVEIEPETLELMELVSKSEELCIKNGEFCIKNEEFCIKMRNFVLKMGNCVLKPRDFELKTWSFVLKTVYFAGLRDEPRRSGVPRVA